MPIDCVWRATKPDFENRDAGDCFFIQEPESFRSALSKHYLADVAAVRNPIVVMIPYRGRSDGWCFPFIIDSHPSAEPDANWDVTVVLETLVDGQKPNITVQPSIKAEGAYHGYLTAGVLDDDIGN